MEGIPQGTNIPTASIVVVGSDIVRNNFGTDVQIRYLVDGQSVEVIFPDQTITFNADEILSPTRKNGVSFEKIDEDGNRTGRLNLFRRSVGEVELTYAREGSFYVGELDHLRSGGFVFGIATDNADMPRTGSATYQTDLSGTVIAPIPEGGSTGYYDLHRDGATFTADFANMSVTTTLRLLTTPGYGTPGYGASGADRDFGSLSGTGTIAASGPGLSGNFTTSDVTGGFAGAFFGPGAAEAGYTFHASHADYAVLGSVFGIRPPSP